MLPGAQSYELNSIDGRLVTDTVRLRSGDFCYLSQTCDILTASQQQHEPGHLSSSSSFNQSPVNNC